MIISKKMSAAPYPTSPLIIYTFAQIYILPYRLSGRNIALTCGFVNSQKCQDRTPRNLPPHPRGIWTRGMRDAYPGA